MKKIHSSFAVLLLLLCLPICKSTSDLFDNWCKKYGKTYASEQEKELRFKVFEDNYNYITQHNTMDNSSYALDLNAFADLTHHEFKATFLGLSGAANNRIRMNPRRPSSSSGVSGDVPKSLDWRKKGAVTGVKDQGRCGACWAFSATGAMEGINKIVSGSLRSLSEQELIDCDRTYNSGCDGGLMDYAYQFVVKNKGIDTEEDYPFQGKEKTCNNNKLKKHVVTIDGYQDVAPNNENELLQAVAKQPVSRYMWQRKRFSAVFKGWCFYSLGVFTGPCSTELDHAVLIVGYDSQNGKDYWIVKNSWGAEWGINGYIHMVRNYGNSEGICGINLLASYPVKTPLPPPPPAPTKCDLFSTCLAGETCCCSWRLPFFGTCVTWKCCELDSAVCCEDQQHCCPRDYPICDTTKNLCLKKAGNYTMVKQLRDGGLSGKLAGWGSGFRIFDV